ncbi:MAG TPA: hypothetical protein VLA72_22875 [Anaerolineales bacterium]|nr:hypothetical protein [Anaerolineales bacterium]
MNYLKEILRLIHILGAMYWFGAALMMYYFVSPTVAATGDAGQKFGSYLGGKSGLGKSMLVTSIASAVAGAWLYWINSNGMQSAWMTSSSGIVFGLGGIFGAIALTFGFIVNRTIAAMGRLGAQIQGKPTPEQVGQMQSLQARNAKAFRITTYTIIISAVCMAGARFFIV